MTDVVSVARGSRTRVLVNDRVDVAIACGAAGVHLRGDSAPSKSVRSIAPAGFVIGRSVHNIEEARSVEGEVDYLLAGTVWPSRSKPADAPVLGAANFAAIVSAVGVPVLAIGGLDLDNLAAVAVTGAAGIAAISLFLGGNGECRATPLARTAAAVRAAFGR